MDEGLHKRILGYSLGTAPGHLIRRCQQRAVDLFVEEVGESGPTPRQFAVLLTVFQNPGISQTELVRLTGIDRSTLTDVLRRLADREFIVRNREAADLRSNSLRITAEGETVLVSAFEAAERAQRRILEPIASAQREETMGMLMRLSGQC